MIGYLIYDLEGSVRNKWFIDRLIALANEKGVTIKLVLDTEYQGLGKPNFAIVRCINPLINKHYEDNGVAVFNSFRVSEIANDKYKTFEFAKGLGIPVMQTALLTDFDTENFNKESFVLKKRNGHGGNQVYLISCKRDFEKLEIKDKENYIVQSVCDTLGVDTRVYCLNNEIVLAVKRKSKEDFRSNFSLGGSAERVEITEKQTEIIKKILKNLSPTFIGIDFIYNDGEWVLNEIEDPVGSRMIYKVSNLDIVNEYVNSVISKVNSKK